MNVKVISATHSDGKTYSGVWSEYNLDIDGVEWVYCVECDYNLCSPNTWMSMRENRSTYDCTSVSIIDYVIEFDDEDPVGSVERFRNLLVLQ